MPEERRGVYPYEVVQKLSDIADRLYRFAKDKKYKNTDARHVALMNCGTSLFFAGIIINIVSKVSDGKLSKKDFIALVGQTHDDVDFTVNIIELEVRLGLIVKIQFQIENLFRSLLRELKVVDIDRSGFVDLAKIIFKQTSLPDAPKKFEIIKTFSLIRNSLHANGWFHGKSDAFNIGGMRFEFKTDERISCAHWRHLWVLLEELVSVVEEILSRPTISDIPGTVADLFVWDIATEPEEE